MADSAMTNKGMKSVYRSLVLSVFADSKILALGVVTTTLAVLLTAYAIDSLVLYALSGLFLALGVLRYVMVRRFETLAASGELGVEECEWWEHRFTWAAAAYALLFGLWCMSGSIMNESFVELVAFSVTFANLIGISGRSFPLARLVTMQLIAISVPLVVGLWFQSGYYALLGVMLVPYMMSVHRVAAMQRETLLGNIFERHKAEKLATQFNTAIENMPQGICMFDSEGKLEVANNHVLSLLERPWKEIKGSSVIEMLKLLETEGGLDKNDARQMRQLMTDAQVRSANIQITLQKDTRRIIRFRSNLMTSGGFVCTLEDITREVESAEKIDRMMRYDPLTGLINRNEFPLRLQEALALREAEENCAVLLINLNRFKQINDVYGHLFGDALLEKVAQKLVDLAGDDGICARFSADEFAILLRCRDGLDVASNLTDQILEMLSAGLVVEGRRLQIGCNIGIAVNRGARDSAAVMLKNADLALLWAKKEGAGTWRIFNSQMSRQLQTRQRLENDLHMAMKKDQLSLVFQPIINVANNRIDSCEALVRWTHPQMGNVPPSTFIPIAEELGLITELGNWVLRKACEACMRWPNGTQVAVNLSPQQLKHDDIVDNVRKALEDTGLPAERLELEVTESAMLDDLEETVGRLLQFKRMGVRISLDDFGTGYSSLNHLSALPIDKLKIDRSFITGIEPESRSLTLLQAIGGMGRRLGLTIVTEGVETESELATLLGHVQVDEIQGYLMSRPIPNDELRSLLRSNSVGLKRITGRLKRATPIAA